MTHCARSIGTAKPMPAELPEPEMMAGVATLALEMIEQSDPLDALFLPVGGGLGGGPGPVDAL